MKTALVLTLVVASTLTLSGCADVWEKPGATQQEFEATKAGCLSRAAARFSPMTRQVQIGSGYTTPIMTNCNGFGYSVNCYTTGGQYVPPSFMTVDDNAGARAQDVRSCFFEHGWHLKENSETATAPANTSSTYYAPTPKCDSNKTTCVLKPIN